jgi:dissimilatory sulfite reductase related protein
MATLTVTEKTYEVDADGYLADIDEWNTEVANYFAKVEGIEMTEQHWEIVNFLHEYYQRYQIAPMIKILLKEISKKFGPQKGNSKYLYELFPDGPAKQACKIAGLPGPTGCV